MTSTPRPATVVADLTQAPMSGPSGVVWGHEGDGLNANLVKLDAGDSIDEHRNDEVEVLLIITSGEGTAIVDGVTIELRPDTVVSIPVGATRSLHATTRLTYLSVHPRRGKLGIARRGD